RPGAGLRASHDRRLRQERRRPPGRRRRRRSAGASRVQCSGDVLQRAVDARQALVRARGLTAGAPRSNRQGEKTMHSVMERIGRRLVLALAVACCGQALAAPPLEPLKVRLDWTPWGVQAAFHLAQHKGWYRQAGLDVALEDGNGSVTTVQIVGGGDSFDVGHAALASMMIARDKGLPVKAVAVFARHSDIGLLVPADSGIKGPAQLKGKRVAYTAGSLEAPFIDAFLAAGGVQRKDVELVNVDAASKATTYAVGRTDAAFSTIPFFLPAVSAKRPSIGIPFADYGLHMPSFGLFASESKLKQRPEVLARFAAVVTRAWKYIYDGHQDEAVQAILAERR